MAPMTPATAFEMPPELEEEGVLEAEGEEPVLVLVPDKTEGEQEPVLFPHALHHCAWEPMAKPFMPDTKALQGR